MDIKINNTKTQSNGRLSAVIYGQSGIGKTTLAGTLSGKTLIISAENGLLALASKDIDYLTVSAWADLHSVTLFLNCDKSAEYKNIFVDSLTEVSEMLINELKNKYPAKSDSMKLWGEYSDKMTAFVKYYRNLNKFNVFFTCLVDLQKDESSARYYHLDLKGKIGDKLPAYFDLVLGADLMEVEDQQTKEIRSVRVLHANSTDKHRFAKDRSGRLPELCKMDLQWIVDRILTTTPQKETVS
jgi:hypothetical protein